MRAAKALGALTMGAALGVGGLSLPSAGAQVPSAPAPRPLTVTGHGYGHGHGMSQYGAEGGARLGQTYRQILAHYYPSTTLRQMHGRIRVLITADTTPGVKVNPAGGLRVRDTADGRTWTLPSRPRIDRWRIRGRRVQLHRAGGWRTWSIPGRTVFRGDGEFHADGPLTLWVPNGGGEVRKRYRGALRAARPSAGSTTRDTVNVLSMDKYVRGVVGAEMPSSWHRAALRSQAVAARTYAASERSRNRARYYHTCDTACQVYGGVRAETASTNRAVRATARQILRYQGQPAFTQFSSSSGGYTASGGQPYLPARRDPWDGWAGNPNHTWRTSISRATVVRHYGLGRLLGIKATRNGLGAMNGRVVTLRLRGSKRTVRVSGDDFKTAFGLRSNWFRVTGL